MRVHTFDDGRIVFLRLRDCLDGVELVAVDRTGVPLINGGILKITNEGGVLFARGLTKEAGLDINEHGTIICDGEYEC